MKVRYQVDLIDKNDGEIHLCVKAYKNVVDILHIYNRNSKKVSESFRLLIENEQGEIERVYVDPSKYDLYITMKVDKEG